MTVGKLKNIENDQNRRRILITAALPYANGMIHLGHLVEYLQADFFARFQKMRGHDCIYICADDTHGTPIMVRARELGIQPEDIIHKSSEEHQRDFSEFLIEFSHFGSTHSPENQQLCGEFYQKIKESGCLARRPIKQLYCPHDKMFLPDRFVKGTCPKCGAMEQYGDSCEVCSSTYTPGDLKDAHCAICKGAPIEKQTEHIFFKLNLFKEYLQKWLPQHTSPEITKKMLEWFGDDLRDWDITRDEPYFGFPIPGEVEKYFYVWVDAPMGYISTTQQWCQKNQRSLDEFWKDDKSEIYHFIGKDIVYFHTLFWPSFLKAGGFKSPTSVFVHGMLMVNGAKMSKSKGTFISARTYLNHLDPEYLRYYYGTKLNSGMDDLDFNMDDFVQRVNSDLVGKIANLGSRGAQMLTKKMDGVISQPEAEGELLIGNFQEAGEMIAAQYEARDFAKATSEIRELVDRANKYFDDKAPWKTLESDPTGTKAVLSTTLNLFRIAVIYLKPLVPRFAANVESLFGEKPYQWQDAQLILKNHRIQEFKHLAVRIDPVKVEAMVEETKKIFEETEQRRRMLQGAHSKAMQLEGKVVSSGASQKSSKEGAVLEGVATLETISIDDFGKVDLRVAQVLRAEEILEADKLLRLQVSLGEGLGERQIIAGIKSSYRPEDLVGRSLVIVANLQPRKMKFGMSEGMVLAASNSEGKLFVISPDGGASLGSKVK